MIKDISGSQKSIDRESEIIYDHLFSCASNDPPQVVIRKFHNLFIQGKNEDAEVSQALNKIIVSPISQQQFDRIFSHCFYLIFDYWVTKPKSLSYISELLNIIEIINKSSSYDRLRKQLIKLISEYQKSQEYLKLKATIAIISPQKFLGKNDTGSAKTQESDEISNSQGYDRKIVNNHLARYTFLYEYIAPQNPELKQLNEFIKSLQNSRRQDFEIKLSRHIIYRYRLKQVAKMKLLSKGAGKVITKVDSPSILSERAFQIALQQYLGKIDGKQTILERSQKFIADNKIRGSYQVFKQDLYQFLIKDIKSRNSSYQINQKLKNKLDDIFAQSDKKQISSTLILQTCRQLFSFFVTELNSNNNPQGFVDLVTNLGTAQALKILIKITLICPESKPDLEKKISLIIDRYQLHEIQDVPWVTKTLEHLLIAFSIYFGKIDVSIAKSAIDK